MGSLMPGWATHLDPQKGESFCTGLCCDSSLGGNNLEKRAELRPQLAESVVPAFT